MGIWNSRKVSHATSAMIHQDHILFLFSSFQSVDSPEKTLEFSGLLTYDCFLPTKSFVRGILEGGIYIRLALPNFRGEAGL